MKVIQNLVDKIFDIQLRNPLQTPKDFFEKALTKYQKDVKRDYSSFNNKKYEKDITANIEKYTTLLDRYESLYLRNKKPKSVADLLRYLDTHIINKKIKKTAEMFFLETRKDKLKEIYNSQPGIVKDYENLYGDESENNKIINKANGHAFVRAIDYVNFMQEDKNEKI